MFTFKTKLAMGKAVLTHQSPFYIQFFVSKYCNLKCKMCNIVEANQDVVPFSTQDIEMIARNLSAIGAGVVLLTGGEPFLRSDIDHIVKVLKKYNLDVRLQTAGLYAQKEKIAQCVLEGARDINVSLDSLDEGLSDYINGVQGSWRNAIRTISYISQTFPSKDSICALGCVLSRYNIREIESILDFATQIGWWLSLVPVHITNKSNPLNFRGYDPYFQFLPEDYSNVKQLITRLKAMKREGYNLFDSDDYLDSIYHFVMYGTPNWRKNKVCDSPNLYFAIRPDGSFSPCCDWDFPRKIYIQDSDFPQIFKSKTFQKEVKSIVTQCNGCNFGSYPEMTLSARSFSTLKERVIMQFEANHKGIRPLKEEEILSTIEQARIKYKTDAIDIKNRRETKFYL